MRAASLPLLLALAERLNQRFGDTLPFTVNPNPERELPFGALGSKTETDGFSTKKIPGSVVTHTIRIYSHSYEQTERFASDAIEEITDPSNPIIFPDDEGVSFYNAGRVVLELNDIIQDRDERGDIYGAAIRFRFWIGQYNQ